MLIDLISTEEKDMIQVLRDYGGSGNQNPNANMVSNEIFLKPWEDAKAKSMGKVFNDKLILKKKINIALEDDELWNKMKRLTWSGDYERLKDALLGAIEEANEDFYRRTIQGVNLYHRLWYSVLSADALVENTYDGPTTPIILPSGKEFKLVHGAKVIKAIGRLTREFIPDYLDVFESVRIHHSQIMNEASLNANLCISIHPLDYMTASYNDCGWRSCMCWEDGEFRRGVIEMMNSPYVVCAYLESSSTKLNITRDLKWNSKRWREFFIVRPELICGIKGYPYWNRTLENEVLKWLSALFANAYNFPYSKNIIEFEVDQLVADKSVDVENLRLCMECGPAMYNDFYSGNYYHVIITPKLSNQTFYTFYSGKSECVICGKVDTEFDSPEDLACLDCYSYLTCYKCGEHIYDGESAFELNERTYCEDCYFNLPNCELCDEKVDPDESTEAIDFAIGRLTEKEISDLNRHLTPDDVVLTPKWDVDDIDEWERKRRAETRHYCVCADCASDTFISGEEEFYKVTHPIFSSWNDYAVVIPVDMFLKEGLIALCGEDMAEELQKRSKVKKSA